MGNFNFSNFTDLGNVEINAGGGFKKDTNRIECKPENGINGMYEYFGRFLPNPYDPSKSMISKSVVKIKNPAVSGETVTFDCPKSIFKPSFFFTMDKVLKKYEEQPGFSEIVKTIKRSFSRWYSISSLMYISQDACHPENVNKIKVFQYGAAINKIIEEVKKGTMSVSGCKPFDLLVGKDFHYIATIKSKALNFADYTSCAFMSTQTPFKYFMDGNYYEVSANELELMSKGQKTLLVKLYEEQCPDMSRYEYQAPTNDQLLKAANYIRIIFAQYPSLLQEIINATDDKEFVALINQLGGLMQPQNQMMGQQGGYQQNQMMGQPGVNPNSNYQSFGYQPNISSLDSSNNNNNNNNHQQPNSSYQQQQPAYQNPVSEGGFIPQSQGHASGGQPAQSNSDTTEVQTFGGGADRFKEAMDNVF